MRVLPPVWCLVFIFSLIFGPCQAQDGGTLIYDIDWNGPPHQLNQPTALGGINAPSRIAFGQMYVRSSIGPLTDRPLEMSQSEAVYDQFELEARRRATRYVLDFDMTHIGSSSLALVIDHLNTGVLRVDLNGDGSLSSHNGTIITPGSYKLTSLMQLTGSYNARSVTHVQMEYDKSTARVTFRINGETRAEWQMNDVSTDFDVQAVRLSSTGAAGIGVDNVKLHAYGSPTAVYVTPSALDFGNGVVGVRAFPRIIDLENPTASPVTLTAVESSSPVFSLFGGPQPPITVAAGGRATLTLQATPALTGENAGTITLRTSAGNFSVPVRIVASNAMVVTQPVSKFLRTGQRLELTAKINVNNVAFYEWRCNNVLVYKGYQGTDTPTFTIPSATLADAGSYQLTAVLLSGVRLTSNLAHVAIVEAQQLTRSAALDSPLTLTCQAAGPSVGNLKYLWTYNNYLIAAAPPGVVVNGNRLEIAQIRSSHVGTYACWVTMEDLGDSQIYQPKPNAADLTVQVTLPGQPTLTTTQLPTVQVGEPVDVQLTTSAPVLRFHATGLPPGIVLNEQTGRLTGTPLVAQSSPATPYRVEFQIVSQTGAPGVSKILDWWVLAPLEPGTYVGLIGRDYLADPDGQGGTFRLTVTAKGKVSGRVTVGRRSASGVGQIQTVTQKGAYEALLNLKPPFSPVSVTLLPYGRLPATEFPLNDGLTGWPLVPKEKAAAFIGHFPTALEVPAPGGPGGGIGFIHLRVNRAGTATWSGVMANGMAVTGSQPLRADWQSADRMQVPFYWLPKGMKSSVLGWLALEGENVDGGLDWGYTQAVGGNAEVRENGIGDGFERCEITAMGSRHTPPPRGVILLGLDRVPQAVKLSPEGPRGVSMHGLIQVLPGHRVVVADPAQFPFPGMQMKINPATSAFSGSYIATRLRNFPVLSTFQGIFVARTGEGLGVLRGAIIPEQPSGVVKLSSIRPSVGSIRITPDQ